MKMTKKVLSLVLVVVMIACSTSVNFVKAVDCSIDGHLNTYYKVLKEASCYDDGMIILCCKDCNEELMPPITSEHWHSYTDCITIREATCISEGVVARECTECDLYEERAVSINKNQHVDNYGNIIGWETLKEPSFHSDGFAATKCLYCGTLVKRIYGDHGLTEEDYVVMIPSTCIIEGIKTAHCYQCNIDVEKPIPLKEHTYSDFEPYSVKGDFWKLRRTCDCGYYEEKIVNMKQSAVYNLGEETYSFSNYGDNDSKGGHCFGMSVTSSGYYLGNLDKSIIGSNNEAALYSFDKTDTVKAPICDYQAIQGLTRDASMVAGGTNYKDSDKYDINSDWKDVVDYVKNHEYDGKGVLQIGFRKKDEGGHAINFIRYEEVNGQPRIYAYDNNVPTIETYFYQNENGEILQAPYSTFSGPIDCITLRNVSTYFKILKSLEIFTALNKPLIFYAFDDSISIENSYKSMMDGTAENGFQYMYELPEGTTTVTITPLVDNATFTYMDKEYSFGEIGEDTYAEFTLSESEEDIPEFEIINEPSDEPEIPDEPQEEDDDLISKIFELIHDLIDFLISILIK